MPLPVSQANGFECIYPPCPFGASAPFFPNYLSIPYKKIRPDIAEHKPKRSFASPPFPTTRLDLGTVALPLHQLPLRSPTPIRLPTPLPRSLRSFGQSNPSFPFRQGLDHSSSRPYPVGFSVSLFLSYHRDPRGHMPQNNLCLHFLDVLPALSTRPRKLLDQILLPHDRFFFYSDRKLSPTPVYLADCSSA